MEMSEALRFRSHNFSLFPRAPISSTEHPHNLMPISPKFSSNTRLSVTTAKKKSSIEGVSEELTAIASLNLDFAPSRRRVRSAFTEVHQQLDHFLFKAAPAGIKTEEWYERNSRGLEIFCKSWMPESGVPLKAALCFCHGYGSTCTFFFEGGLS
ncbi:uncharacterized protein LOC124834213 [Vigna umbellata]|uniref:uncharacterized protein LOC124834213 n=1 Tax=Vigna umbellata TaxID=87088 RepID=UPI001F5FE6E1|nr:uncharacterized protein LOC124834213 [Vigna umbellata]